MNEPSDVEAVRLVIENYIEGSRGNGALLRSIFHPEARMTGYFGGNLMVGTPEPFFGMVEDSMTPDLEQAYKAEIRSIEVAGEVATAKLVETGFMGSDFTDFFQLIREEDAGWRIISKTFHQVTAEPA